MEAAAGSPLASTSSRSRADSTDFPEVVELSIGGAHFAASLETLAGDRFGSPSCGDAGGGAGSMLSAMFSGRIPTRRDAEGRYFIDRDGRNFHHILNFLRDGKYPVALARREREEVVREASFYGLEAMAAHLRADLGTWQDGGSGGSGEGGVLSQAVSASEATEMVMSRGLEEWPEFASCVQAALEDLLAAGGLSPEPVNLSGVVVLDESSAQSLQDDYLVTAQIPLAHITDSKAWQWSRRKQGLNSVLRAKLLRCHLQRLGYSCRIVSRYDKKEICAYYLQVELPMPT
mmetsp:Transcript_55268/g.140138  ORF Transcript_55268/g.140138 Transcript_55268/m.140138 type:complete len:289 (-) Transcript_55268:89-955(-)